MPGARVRRGVSSEWRAVSSLRVIHRCHRWPRRAFPFPATKVEPYICSGYSWIGDVGSSRWALSRLAGGGRWELAGLGAERAGRWRRFRLDGRKASVDIVRAIVQRIFRRLSGSPRVVNPEATPDLLPSFCTPNLGQLTPTHSPPPR